MIYYLSFIIYYLLLYFTKLFVAPFFRAQREESFLLYCTPFGLASFLLYPFYRAKREENFLLYCTPFGLEKVCAPPWQFRKILEFPTYYIFIGKMKKTKIKTEKKTRFFRAR